METIPFEDEASFEAQYQLEDECNRLSQLLLGSSALAKACMDDCFDYALKLSTGEVIRFQGAKVISPDWVHLDVLSREDQPEINSLPYRAARGVDVRICDIVWVMDAPEGS